ncbi:hypothetical protein [Pseudoalteromonas sp. APC 3250]|uniref:hypothetical protein n=1 Tax=Pseudoalteromonas sp. APC 3250 TaxID=3035184 RepID=UPI0025B2A0F5|nr:hypothetical protein [Pseudoalteromonas sp. APC 3250]MDN3413785.1 hypothetical protein [Pseudoalteromonas sp. APC 3250]
MKGWQKINGSDTVIIFIHGLFSSPECCWKNKATDTFWPNLITQDSRFKNPSVFLAQFYTSPTSNDYGVQECAEEVKGQLTRVDVFGNRAPITFEKVVFVTHSTGGIVARYILEQECELFRDKRVALFLGASPSYGSKIPFLARALSKLTNHQLSSELTWGSEILKDLDGRFRKFLDSKKVNICGVEAVENKAPFRIPFTSRRVVNKESAVRYFHSKTIPNSDHSSIVKPNGKEHHSHELLLDLLVKNEFLSKYNDVGLENSPVLFDRYELKHEPYYFEREEDHKLTLMLSHYSLWVCGESGTGKTSSILRELFRRNVNFKYISLASCLECSFHEIFDAILEQMAPELIDCIPTSNINSSISKISEVIDNEVVNGSYFLFIEEIPIKNIPMFNQFAEYLFSLITKINGGSNVRIILSSIFQPNNEFSAEQEKVSERLKILEWPRWENKDISQLIELIRSNLAPDSSLDFCASELNGNPRKVKEKFREKLMEIGYE